MFRALKVENPRVTAARMLTVALPTFAVAAFTEKIFYVVPTVALTLMIAQAIESGTTSSRNRIEDDANVVEDSDSSEGSDGDSGPSDGLDGDTATSDGLDGDTASSDGLDGGIG